MLSIIINWLYVTITIFPLGYVVVSLFKQQFGSALFRLDEILMSGLVIVTMYAQVFSLFYKVGLLANIVLCILSLVCFILYRRQITEWIRMQQATFSVKKSLVFLIVLLIICYFTSRGYEHYDTGLYHAQAIRWIEEYGIVKGLGNLNYRLAYNSAGFAVTALYSMAFMLEQSLHTISGYFVGLLALASVVGFQKNPSRKIRISDTVRIAAMYYITTTFASLNSPSSDYFAMSIVLYIVLCYTERIEQKETNVAVFAWISLLSCFAITLKFSAAPILFITIKPAVMLLKDKDFKKIGTFLCIGFLIALPFLIRGIIISGWLIYPSTTIDLFPFEFKVHEEIAKADRLAVTLWGRNAVYGESISSWLPRWFASIPSSVVKGFILLDVLVLLAMIVLYIYEIMKRNIKLELVTLDLTIVAGFLFWFISSPLIRYGYAYILLLAFVGIGRYMTYVSWSKIYRLFTIGVLFIAYYKTMTTGKLLVPFIYYDNYIWQQDYYVYDTKEQIQYGYTFYVSDETDQVGYHAFPAGNQNVNYELIGTTIEEGFKYK